MVQWITVMILVFDVGAPVRDLVLCLQSSSLLIVCGKEVKDGPSTWNPLTHKADQSESLASWLQPIPALAIVVIWGLIKVLEFLSHYLSFSVTLSNKS